MTRKVGAPGHAELGIGAIAEGGGTVANRTALQALGLSPDQFERLVAREREELERRVRRYRGDRPLPDLEGRDVVLVDDGLATGVTAEAALRALRSLEPRRLILAVPVCARSSADRLSGARRRGGVPLFPRGVLGCRPVVRGLRPDHRRRGARPARPPRSTRTAAMIRCRPHRRERPPGHGRGASARKRRQVLRQAASYSASAVLPLAGAADVQSPLGWPGPAGQHLPRRTGTRSLPGSARRHQRAQASAASSSPTDTSPGWETARTPSGLERPLTPGSVRPLLA